MVGHTLESQDKGEDDITSPSHVTTATVLYYTPVVGQYIVILYYTVVDCVQTAAKSVAATCGRVL